ncbi:MAG: hypothetical protein SFY81_10230 [Verrucomicrobiota bacterium]|nr:hypothetical protein [Verrucomicrobiota bacterium]
MKMITTKAKLAITALSLLPLSLSAAEPISSGTYKLGSHPDGGLRPPLYGLRLDGLLDANNNGHFSDDRWTFDFDNPLSSMWMDLNTATGTAHIYGYTIGGADKGYGPANDTYIPGTEDIFHIDFTYTGLFALPADAGVGPGLDDLVTGVILTPGTVGTGTITKENGAAADQTWLLRDVSMVGHYNFQLGDNELNDLGIHGYPGITGAGWVNYSADGGQTWEGSFGADFFFTAVPEPSTVISGSVLGLLAAGGAFRRFRKQA